VKPLKLAKAIALAFALGAILSVGSDPKLTHQAETMAQAQAKAIATSAMQALSTTLGHSLELGLDAVLKGV
jgi:signal transduction histidine kinase